MTKQQDETRVGDTRGTGCGAQGGERRGRRMVVGEEVKKGNERIAKKRT